MSCSIQFKSPFDSLRIESPNADCLPSAIPKRRRDGLERSRFRNAWRSTKRRAWLPPARRANVLSVNSAESIYTPWNFESDSRHARVGASPQEIARLEPALGWKERATERLSDTRWRVRIIYRRFPRPITGTRISVNSFKHGDVIQIEISIVQRLDRGWSRTRMVRSARG